jgi:DNA-binding winged helix-turn-helix (wHTH) protein
MAPRIRAFGPFEFERSGEMRVLRRQGVRLKIQGQPLDILERLMEHPGQIVSRQDLQQLLWGGEVHVDFERGLNTAMKRLRAVLGDDAVAPRYIETVARTGYVFIGEAVEVVPVITDIAMPVPVEGVPSRR